MTGSTATDRSRALLLGVLFKALNVLSGVVMLALARAMKDIPVIQIMFFRAAFAIVPIALWFGLRGELSGVFRTKRLIAHGLRSLVGMSCTLLAFVAVQNLPLADAVTLQYSQPLFVVAFSALFLREVVGRYRWAAVVFGFLGVLVVSWPNLTLLSSVRSPDDLRVVGVAAALLGSAGVATVLLMTGDLVRTESPGTVTVYAWLIGTIVLSFTACFWEPLTLKEATILILIGFVGGLVQLFMAISLTYAKASVTASFEYTSLIFASAIAFLMWGDLPGAHTLAGAFMVIAAGLFIIWRENRLGRKKRMDPGNK